MAISLVQTNFTTSANTPPSQSLAFTSNNTAGNALACLFYTAFDASPLTTVVDTQLNTWVIKGPVQDSFPANVYIAYCLSCKAGANTVTIADPNADAVVQIESIAEINTSVGTWGFDVTSQNVDNSPASGTHVGANLVTNFANEIILCNFLPDGGSNSNAGATVNSPFSLLTTGNLVGPASYGLTGYQIVSSTGTYACTANTVGTPSNWTNINVGLYVVGGVVAPNLRMLMGAGT